MRKLCAGVLIAAMAALSSQAMAMDYKAGNLTVSDPWARASAGKAPNGAAYFTVTNAGAETDRLIKITTQAAAKAELHTMAMKDGIMMMRRLKGIEVAPGEPMLLKPGGLHVMLMGLKVALKENTVFHLTLTFETAGTLEIPVTVMKAGAMGSMHHNPHHQMKHDHKNI